MTIHNFNFKEIFDESWSKTKENAWFLFCMLLVTLVIIGVTNNLHFISPIVGMLVSISILTVSLVISHEKKPHLNDLIKSFKNYKIAWHYLLASILYGIIVVVGLILFILPGIYLAVRLQFYKFLIIENEDLSVIDSLKGSMEMTDNNFWKLFGFIMIIIIANIIGAIPFGLGLILTIPISLIASTLLYNKLKLPNHAI